MNYRINKHISSTLQNSYAKESETDNYRISIDCYEGINNITFSKNALETLNNINYTHIKDYPHGTLIKDSIVKYWNDKDDKNIESDNIILCDGSISGIYIVNRLFLELKDEVLGYIPQFPEYGMDVKMHGCNFDYYTLKKENNYKFIAHEFIECINKDYKLIYIDNPNNPTGQIIPLSSIEKILEKSKKENIMVIIDEAYGEYMDRKNSAINLMKKFDNLIVLKTFSKGFALAGLRAGYIVAPRELKDALNKITNPYSISEIGRRISSSALKDYDFILDTLNKSRDIKSRFMRNWKNLKMGETSDSVSIFLLEHKNKDIVLKDEFAKWGISVVCGSNFQSLGKNCVRFRIPSYKDLDEVISVFECIDNL